MKILVLGGSGFLGKKLIDKMSRQSIELHTAVRSVPLLLQRNCNYILIEDLEKGSSSIPLEFDVIVNVAMKRSSKRLPVPDDDLRQLNYEIPLNIIRRYSNQNTLVINTSTYIQNYKGIKGQTVETYGATKELLSSALKSDAGEGMYRVLDLYLFTLYGPGDRETHLVPLLLSAIKSKTVVSLSEGKQLLNLLYAQDAVDSIVGAITNSKKGYSAYHLWEPVYFTVRDLVLAIEQSLETKMQVEWGAVPYGGHEMFEPWAIPIEKYPNLVSKTSLADGIKLTFESMN